MSATRTGLAQNQFGRLRKQRNAAAFPRRASCVGRSRVHQDQAHFVRRKRERRPSNVSIQSDPAVPIPPLPCTYASNHSR
jgi:hypothetical protein